MSKYIAMIYKIYVEKRALIIIIALFIMFSNLYSSDSIYRIPSKLSNIDSKSLWIENQYLVDSTSIDSIFSFSNSNSINMLYLKIRDNGEAFYNSNIVCKHDSLKINNFDPLQYAISKIEQDSLEIKLIAWLDTYKLWDLNYYPSQLLSESELSHFYYQCPECLDADETGRPDSKIQLDILQSRDWDGIYLAPTHPKVNPYIVSIIEEIITNYKVSGIYLDNIQYQDFYYGYNEEGINEFESINAFTPLDFYRGIISEVYGYSEEEVKRSRKMWDDFRKEKINELIESVSSRLNLYENISLYVGIDENLQKSQSRLFSDWEIWLNNDYVDYLVIKEENYNLIDFIYSYRNIESIALKDNLNKFIYQFSIEQSQIDIIDKIFFLRLNQNNNMGFVYDLDIQFDWYKPILNTLNFTIN